jgi:hypothetical protein
VSLAAILLILVQSERPDAASLAREQVPLLADPETRPRALDRLSHAGKEILPLLEARGADAEALRLVREAVSLHASLGESYAPPRLLSFEGKEESLGALLSRFEAASGMTFHKHAVELATPQTLALKDAPFWEALDVLARKVPFTYQAYAGDQLYLNAGMPGEKPVSYYGPFRMALDRVVFQRRVGFDRTTEELTPRLHVLWENHVAPIGATRRFRLSRADDDRGTSLLLPPADEVKPAAARPLVVPNRIPWEMLDLGPLRPLSPGAKAIAVLEGTFDMEFPLRVEKAVFDKAGTHAVDGIQVDYRASSPGVSAEFVLRFPDEKQASAHRLNPRDVSFVSTTGAFQPCQIVDSKIEKASLSFTVRAMRMSSPRELKEVVLRLPRGSAILQVPFRFRNLELR